MKILLTVVAVLASLAFPAVPLLLGAEPKALDAKKLPSGMGIAAKHPGDAGIAEHAAVIFADGFEGGDYKGHWDEARDKTKRVLSLEDPGEADRLGSRCLKVTARLGKDTGGGVTKWFKSAPTLHVRFYTKFAGDCDYVHHFVTLRANRGLSGGDKWSGFGGAGDKPDGARRFSTALEPWGNWRKYPPPGRWNFYSYWSEMKAAPDGKFWGNSFRPGTAPNIARGKWICCEFMLVHNTPGKADGEQAFWIDGVPQGHWTGFNWRSDKKLMANALTLESYVTDRWTKNPVNTVWFDNVVIAREYVGPAAPKAK